MKEFVYAKFLTITSALLLSTTAMASSPLEGFETSKVKDTVPIVDLQLSPDDNTILGVAQYPNGCYQPFHSFEGVKNKTLVLVHVAEFSENAICTRALQFIDTRFPIEELDPGTYTVIDGNDGTKLAELDKEPNEARLITIGL